MTELQNMKLANELLDLVGEAKDIELPGIPIKLVGFGTDANGNTVVKLKNSKGKEFSIPTDGNLNFTHALRKADPKKIRKKSLDNIADEIKDYISKRGTKIMKEVVDGEE